MTFSDWDNNLLNLRDILADLYLEKSESMRVVRQANLNPVYIRFKDKPIDNWFWILEYAQQDATFVDGLIDVAISEQLPAKKGVLLQAKQRMLNVRGADIIKDVDWKRPLDSRQLEKITGKQSTLLPISFLEMGLQRARAVARIDLGWRGSGSGFLIGADVLLTNHHVLENEAQAHEAKAVFNYQWTAGGLAAICDEYELDPGSLFRTSSADDWTAVRLKPKQMEPPGATWAVLEIREQDPKVDDFTIIIQHPGGGPKQIALYHNVIAYVDATKRVVQYLTDTEPGSSGSPVFDTNWNVVALHHSGGWLREPGNNPEQTFYRNEGIHINTIIAGLRSGGVL